MNEQPLKFIYVTLPDPDRPILNIQAQGSDELHRYELTRGDLYRLNLQIADALLRGIPR
jgi:hypothetical protein